MTAGCGILRLPLVGRVRDGNAVILVEPLAEVDQPAPRRAEGKRAVALARGRGPIADRAPGHGGSIAHPPGGLARYYRTPVIGGSGAFLVGVENFNSFAEAMAKKPAREIDLAARGTTRPMAVEQ